MKDKHKRVELIWMIFLVLQPLIDVSVLTSSSLPSVIRGGFLFVTIVYLIKHKRAQIYLILIACYGLIYLGLIYAFKDPVSLTMEISYLIKTIYFPIVLLFAKNFFPSRTYVNLILINLITINGIMIVAGLTQTGKRTYNMLAKQGHTGWFFSGNELSVILMIGLAIILFKLLTTTNKKYIAWIYLLLIVQIVNMLTVGTKVSLFSVFILLAIGTLLAFKKPSNKMLGTIFLSLFIIVYFVFPNTPAGHNTLRIVTESNSNTANQLDNGPAIDQMLSGRRDFLLTNIGQFQQAPLALNLFGLGYGGLYEDQPKLVEMDGFDWLFGFGLIGTLIFIYPLIVLAIEIWSRLTKRVQKDKLIIIVAVLLTIGSAFSAGHVMSAPAVSIYFILLIVILDRQFDTQQKLLVITTMYPSKKTPSFGIFIKNQVEALKKHDLKIDVLAIKNQKMDPFNVYLKYFLWLIRFNFILIFKAEYYEIVHAHYVFPSGWLGQIIKHMYGTRLIVTAHGGDLDKMPKKQPRIKTQIKHILADADQVIAVGETLKQELNNNYKVEHNKLTVLNMGVNRQTFKPGNKPDARKKLKLPSDKALILFVGNLIKAKGLEELVMACELVSEHEQVQCHLVGANKEPTFLTQLLSSTTIDLYRHEATSQQEVAYWLRAADMLILPSHIEGFGLVALEAMACHTPVIGTNVGGLGYLLADEAGLTVPSHDPEALAQAINQLIQNQPLREKLIKNGEEKANNFDQEKVIKKLIQLYNKEPSR